MSDCNRWSLLLLLLKYKIYPTPPPGDDSVQSGKDGIFSEYQVMENRYSLRLSPSKDARFDRIKINRSNFPRMLLQH